MPLYDPKKHAFSFKTRLITGFAPGTFISASRNSDTFTLTKGTDGFTTWNMSSDRSGRITITLMGLAPSNDILSSFMVADEKTGLGAGPIALTDLNSRTIIASREARIIKPPEIARADEVSPVEWVFEMINMEIFIGGQGPL